MFDESYFKNTIELLEDSKKSGFDFNKFKEDFKNKSISINDVKNILIKLIAHNANNLGEETKDIFDIMNYILAGTVALANPLLVIPVLFANKIIRDAADAKMIGKYISKYNIEINNIEKKIEKEEDQSSKRVLEAYRDNLIKSKEILMEKRQDMEYDKEESQVKQLIDSTNIFRKEVSILTEEQFNELFDDMDILAEGSVINKAKHEIKSVAKTAKDKKNGMDRWFDKTLKEIRDKKQNEARDRIVERGFPKLSSLIGKAISIGVAWAINPALAGITFAVNFVLYKRKDIKERLLLLRTLKKELVIVEEKIKDADSNGDREKKYELMRLKNKLETDIDKIKKFI